MRFWRSIWPYLIAFLLLVGLICFFPYWFAYHSWHNIDFRNTGQIGDTLGGIMGPFIAIIAAGLTFAAFWMQIKANEIQKDALLKQESDLQRERFENRFYEMVRLHRENVAEMSISNTIKGRKVLVNLFYELQLCYHGVDKEAQIAFDAGLTKQELRPEEVLEIAYSIFFYGLGVNSNKLLEKLDEKYDPVLIAGILKDMEIAQNYIRKEKTGKKKYIFPFSKKDRTKLEFDVKYIPFDGHLSRLGHYYRHLFQSVKFVVENFPGEDGLETALSYLRTLRAQLSTHEQLLLYYNATTPFGEKWLDNEYLTKYKMIHNLPLPLADFGIKPLELDKIEEGEKYWKAKEECLFEWHE